MHAYMSRWWTLPHALLVVFHLLRPPIGLCAMPHRRLLGAQTSKGFSGPTSTNYKNTNDIGIQQQLMHFHPCISSLDTYRTSLGHLVQFFLLRTCLEPGQRAWSNFRRKSTAIRQCGLKLSVGEYSGGLEGTQLIGKEQYLKFRLILNVSATPGRNA